MRIHIMYAYGMILVNVTGGMDPEMNTNIETEY